MSALGQNQTFSREHYNLPLESVVVHHNKVEPPMSALGQKRTWRGVRPMSALPPTADMDQHARDLRFVPIAEVARQRDYSGSPAMRSLMRLSSGTDGITLDHTALDLNSTARRVHGACELN